MSVSNDRPRIPNLSSENVLKDEKLKQKGKKIIIILECQKHWATKVNNQVELFNNALKKTVPDQNNQETGSFSRTLEAKPETHWS